MLKEIVFVAFLVAMASAMPPQDNRVLEQIVVGEMPLENSEDLAVAETAQRGGYGGYGGYGGGGYGGYGGGGRGYGGYGGGGGYGGYGGELNSLESSNLNILSLVY